MPERVQAAIYCRISKDLDQKQEGVDPRRRSAAGLPSASGVGLRRGCAPHNVQTRPRAVSTSWLSRVPWVHV